MVSHIYKFTNECHSQTTPSSDRRELGPAKFFSNLCWQVNLQLWHRVIKPLSLSLLIVRPKRLSCSTIKLWSIYTNSVGHVIARLTHPWSTDRQRQETFLESSVDKQTRNYDLKCCNHHPFKSTLKSKWLISSKIKQWAIYTNLPVIVIVRLPHPLSGDSKFSAPSGDIQSHKWHRVLKPPSLPINPKAKGIEL